QSIYRFRGARSEVFTDLCGRFGEARIALSRSFRTHPAGAAFVNHVFGRLMDDYEPITSARDESPPDASVEILLAECEDTSADGMAEAQAEVLAQRVAEMIGREKRVWDREAGQWREVRAGDVAILFARMTKSLQYERALQQRGVPYHVLSGSGFFQQQEIYDCVNALAAIDNPSDDVALFGVLRGGMFGLDDNVLAHVARAVRPPYFHRLIDPAVAKRLTGPQAEQLAFAHAVLARLGRIKDAIGPAGVLEALLGRTGYAATLLSGLNGPQRLGNVHRLLHAARSAHLAGDLSLADFVRRIGEFVLAESRHEQAAVTGEGEDVVRILTIHKAKGLEFPVVFIPDLNVGARGPDSRMLFRHDWGLT
ncbi:hypothetical protein LCGC14_3000420, partial [marine sediment metagenome]